MTWQTLIPSIVAALSGLVALIAAIRVLAESKQRSAQSTSEIRRADINGQAVVLGNLLTECTRLSARIDVIQAEKKVIEARVSALEVERATLQRQVGDLRTRLDHVLEWAIPRGYEPPD